MRQSIRGYTDAVVEQASAGGELSATAEQLRGVQDIIAGSEDLRFVLQDPGVPVHARRGLVTDLLQGRVTDSALRLLTFVVDADRATEFIANVAWLVARLAAGTAPGAPAGGEVVLGRSAAAERLDGYAAAVLEGLDRERTLGEIEDELFRFMRVVDGSEQLSAALTSRTVAAESRRALVVDLLSSRATPATVSLAAYATRVARPRDYPDLLAHLVDTVAAESNRRLAEVRAAVALDEAQQEQLAGALGYVAGRDVEVRVTVDPQVIGGFVATIGDTVVDGSVRHRLELLKERLTTPEAHSTTGEPS